MSAIALLVGLAFVYAVVVLFLVLQFWTPPLVELSVRLYRVLLGAYPATFRAEYGEAMAQLFRDTARDGYRRRGVFGLAAVWLRTLVDFTISVSRQHRDRPAEAGRESILLRDLLRQWGRLLREGTQFGYVSLSVTVLSGWYVLHLLRLFSRRTALFCAVLCALIFGMEAWSFFDRLSDTYGAWTWVRLRNGSMEIDHIYELGSPVPEKQWWDAIKRKRDEDPFYDSRFAPIPTAWEFSFLSEIPGGRGAYRYLGLDRNGGYDYEKLVQPTKSWRLRLPWLLLLLFPLGWAIRARLRGHTASGSTMQSV